MTNIEIEQAELIMPFRNFSGKASKFNREGSRSFAVYIPEDLVENLRADGWNVKYTKGDEENDIPRRPYLNVAVNFAIRPPEIFVGTNASNMKKMSEESVGELDFVDIANVDLSIRPRKYEFNGQEGVKAYLAEMYVIINRSNFASKYSVDIDG